MAKHRAVVNRQPQHHAQQRHHPAQRFQLLKGRGHAAKIRPLARPAGIQRAAQGNANRAAVTLIGVRLKLRQLAARLPQPALAINIQMIIIKKLLVAACRPVQVNVVDASLRRLRQLTQEQAAERVGVTRQTIGMIEAGRFNPSLALCVAICRALGKTLNDLFWEEGDDGA